MKNFERIIMAGALVAALMVSAGCGGDITGESPYPALNESPPPPPPARPVLADEFTSEETPSREERVIQNEEVEPEVMGEGWMTQEALMRDQVDALRKQAAAADPDDPFALTEERIKAFEEAGNPFIH